MKKIIWSLIITLFLLPIGGCGQSKYENQVISVVKSGFPLTYETINRHARENGGTEKKINATILRQCECFVLVGNMLINPETNCEVSKKAFGTFFILATLENTYIKDLTPEKMFECIESISFDQRFSCMDLNWNGVLRSLLKQMMEYKEIEEKHRKNKTIIIT